MLSTQGHSTHGPHRESGDADGNQSIGLAACSHADLEEIIALYRLLDDKDVTFEFLMQPHEPQTRQQLEARSLVLRVAETTRVDRSHLAQTACLSQVGNERG